METAISLQPHVVALDDDPSIRELVSDYLTENELRVTAVASGRELADVMARETIDLVVLDLRLQGEDGMQIARKLREASAIPILMLTGRIEEADRVMGLELGADDYLTKPFSPRELLARIRALLRRAKAQATVADADRQGARLSLRRLGAERRAAPAEDRGRASGRADQRRIQPAGGVSVGAAAHADARPAARAFAAAQRRGLRPLDRRADPAPAPQDRGRSGASAVHPTERGAGYVFDAEVEAVR